MSDTLFGAQIDLLVLHRPPQPLDNTLSARRLALQVSLDLKTC